MRASIVISTPWQWRLAVVALVAARFACAGSIYVASDAGQRVLAWTYASVNYSGFPAPAVSDRAEGTFPVRLTINTPGLNGSQTGLFEACFSFDTVNYGDFSVSSYAQAAFGGVGGATLNSLVSGAGGCTTAIPYTVGVSSVFEVSLYSTVYADSLTRDPTRAFDVTARASLTGLRGYDPALGITYTGLSFTWEPLVSAAAVPEPSSFPLFALFAAVAAVVRRRQTTRNSI